MKNITAIAFLLFTTCAFAQVAIGKNSISNEYVSLEFGNTGDTTDRADPTKQKGIVLPWVTTVAGTPTADYTTTVESLEDGTLIFDLSDYKVKYRRNGSWADLTIKDKSELIAGITNNDVVSTIQDSKTELPEAKVSIGNPTSTNGILVLEDKDKAMVLPLVDKYSSVIDPAPGMMVYDLSNDMLCVYNGTVWTFWKP